MNARSTQISKYLSKHLRHTPEALGLTLEPGGWVLVDDLLMAAAEDGFGFTLEELTAVVASSDKQRFSFDDARSRIRANQGHSVEVELYLSPCEPPAQLYHGTAQANLDSILKVGIEKRRRHHVHLSADSETALRVGRRHGKPVILTVDTIRMRSDGYLFFVSTNGVWLTDHVPPEYLSVMDNQ